MLKDSQLIEWNSKGLIPGPMESEEDFTKRAVYCLELKERISKELQTDLGEEASGNSSLLLSGIKKAKSIYGIEPLWIPIFFSNYRLSCWHGGCAWIFQMTENEPLGALLQLRQKFKASDTYLSLYHRDELIAHEMAHVGRMAFEEPRFEEFLAYKTSSSRFRRWFGPIIQSSVESMLLFILLGLIFFVDISLIAFGELDAYTTAMWLKLLPLCILSVGLFRLWTRHRILNLCLNNLTLCLCDKQKALEVAYRLCDAEIKAFSKMTCEAICKYAEENRKASLRWRMINKVYFF